MISATSSHQNFPYVYWLQERKTLVANVKISKDPSSRMVAAWYDKLNENMQLILLAEMTISDPPSSISLIAQDGQHYTFKQLTLETLHHIKELAKIAIPQAFQESDQLLQEYLMNTSSYQ